MTAPIAPPPAPVSAVPSAAPFRLRGYQTRLLASLAAYLDEATGVGAQRAFVLQTGQPYRPVPQLPELPYVCLRVPTGGGKTILAAHAVGIAAQRWVQRDRVVCLWLVPSNAIRAQTLTRLRTPGDPYHEALRSRFTGPVTVLDLAEALSVTRGTLDGETVVIVSTLAALRVTDTEGRKIYEPAGALAHHFTGLAPALLAALERREDGTPVESLANVLRLRRPVVVMDEAHNARTPLSFDTLARFAPTCVLEFTATPATRHAPDAGHFASNVLDHVSAAELKAEAMIKLPVRLWTYPTWTDAVGAALATQRRLEAAAVEEQRRTGEALRPIILFQAQARRDGTAAITPDALKRALVEDHHVPAEWIAIETGSVRELDGVDLAAPTCPVRCVITVQALREGWDCPQAYVLCSIAEQTSARAVEQLLGRVLRLPGARRKQDPALDVAYAHVVSDSFAAAAEGLGDALVEAGFARYEVPAMIADGTAAPGLFRATPDRPAVRMVREAPAAEAYAALPDAVSGAVAFDPAAMTVAATAPLSDDAAERLAECFATPEGRWAVRSLARASRGELAGTFAGGASGLGDLPLFGDGGASGAGAGAGAPVTAGHPDASAAAAQPPLRLPLLAIRVDDGSAQGTLELFEDTHFLEAQWRLAACDPALDEAAFPLTVRAAQAGEVDVADGGRVTIAFRDAVEQQLTLLEGEPGWTLAQLTVWLDAHIPHPDLTQGDVRLFLHRALEALQARTGATVAQLAREKYRLRRALEQRIAEHRKAQRGAAYLLSLFADVERRVPAPGIVVEPSVAVAFDDPERYAFDAPYQGAYRFRKHVFPIVRDLKADGDEHTCAVRIDEHPHVARWVRNVPRRPGSFWLQTATDRFYPDFVGELVDGRVFAVEYKSERDWSNDDSREKRLVGELWATASGGRCVFLMPRGTDWGALESALAVS